MKYIVTGHGKKVARVVDGVEERIADCGTAATPDECTANAILIATALNAAPALLAALERLADASEEMASSDPEMPSHGRTETAFEGALDAARAAIALVKE